MANKMRNVPFGDFFLAILSMPSEDIYKCSKDGEISSAYLITWDWYCVDILFMLRDTMVFTCINHTLAILCLSRARTQWQIFEPSDKFSQLVLISTSRTLDKQPPPKHKRRRARHMFYVIMVHQRRRLVRASCSKNARHLLLDNASLPRPVDHPINILPLQYFLVKHGDQSYFFNFKSALSVRR